MPPHLLLSVSMLGFESWVDYLSGGGYRHIKCLMQWPARRLLATTFDMWRCILRQLTAISVSTSMHSEHRGAAWAALPCDVLALVLLNSNQTDRVAAASVCKVQ